MNATSELLGHNAAGITVNVNVKMFNSVSHHAGRDGAFRRLAVAAGSDIGDILKLLDIPLHDVFLVLVNGHDITPGKPPKLGAIRTTLCNLTDYF